MLYQTRYEKFGEAIMFTYLISFFKLFSLGIFNSTLCSHCQTTIAIWPKTQPQTTQTT